MTYQDDGPSTAGSVYLGTNSKLILDLGSRLEVSGDFYNTPLSVVKLGAADLVINGTAMVSGPIFSSSSKSNVQLGEYAVINAAVHVTGDLTLATTTFIQSANVSLSGLLTLGDGVFTLGTYGRIVVTGNIYSPPSSSIVIKAYGALVLTSEYHINLNSITSEPYGLLYTGSSPPSTFSNISLLELQPFLITCFLFQWNHFNFNNW
ncbi:hypothetical protein DFA_09253 [Cavenderia fasciculata]|uniref:Uncharacterized protein n=1 Tax=Cavenderia fasciculata TaxID=261658 RepID=F4Q741_CACFS|nr:uncharacterized protein DFA_09253 [Cavenderia fasciculata]EGG16223.1 hypothetical protein DFA_09253 [Cavenderia fasciculata]|eukprot:XP_004354607.1 hypothetical protein DFA_09253 [Cavenderia fasciculata]